MVCVSSFRRLSDGGVLRRNEDKRFRLSNELSITAREVRFRDGGPAQRHVWSIPFHGCRGTRTDGEVLEARAAWRVSRETSLQRRQDGGRWEKWHQSQIPCPASLWGKDTAPKKTPQGLSPANKHLQDPDSSLAQQTVLRRQETANLNLIPPLCRNGTDLCRCRRRHSSGSLQLFSPSGNTKGNSGSACRARIRLSCVIVIPVSISTAGLCPLAAAVVRHLDPRSNEIVHPPAVSQNETCVPEPVLVPIVHSGRQPETDVHAM